MCVWVTERERREGGRALTAEGDVHWIKLNSVKENQR